MTEEPKVLGHRSDLDERIEDCVEELSGRRYRDFDTEQIVRFTVAFFGVEAAEEWREAVQAVAAGDRDTLLMALGTRP